jgi:protein dpy-30
VLDVQESSVVPLLMQALQSLCKERPDDPVEYVANYLLQHNPKKAEAPAKRSQQPGGAAAAADSAAQPAQVGSSKT